MSVPSDHGRRAAGGGGAGWRRCLSATGSNPSTALAGLGDAGGHAAAHVAKANETRSGVQLIDPAPSCQLLP